jgi:hypothetical protein
MTNRTDHTDRRGAKRLPRKEQASIQLVFPGENADLQCEVSRSFTLDVSLHGFRLLLSRELEPHRIFDVCIELAAEPKRFLLTGETRWCRYNSEQSAYEVGLEILDGEGTDYESWEKHFFDYPAT